MLTVIKRAFNSNLQKVATLPREQAVLEAAGIQNPTLQSYLAWRKSLMVFIIVVTVLSSALKIYRKDFEPDTGPGAFETMTARFSKAMTEFMLKEAGSQSPLKSLGTQAVLEKVGEAKSVLEEQTGNDEESDNGGVENAADEPAEAKRDADSPGATTSEPAVDAPKPESLLSQIDEELPRVALYVIFAVAFLAVFNWTRFRLTFNLLIAAFAFSFLAPILVLFCPWSWWEPEAVAELATASKLDKLENMAYGIKEGVEYLGFLLPTVLSLLPGVQKACLRVKTLVPQSTLPGWFLVAAAPFYGLFLLAVSVAANQIFGSPFVLIGLLLITFSSLIYGICAKVFTRPLVTKKDYRQMLAVQKTAGIMTMVAGCLLLYFVQSHDVMGVRLLGFDHKTSILQPLDLVELFVETIGRAMFMTVLGADIMMRINLVAWKNTRDFIGTDEATKYDAAMSAFEQTR